MPPTRSGFEITYIGYETAGISGNQLPSNRQILQLFYYFKRSASPKLIGGDAVKQVIKECMIFWNYAQIPVIETYNAEIKMNKLVKWHESVLKYSEDQIKKSEAARDQIDAFKVTLDDLFNIAHQKKVSALNNKNIKILLNQRGRLNMVIDTEKERSSNHQVSQNESPVVYQAVGSNKTTKDYSDFISAEEEDQVLKLIEECEQIKEDDPTDSDYRCPALSRKPKKMKIITTNITAVLDRAKISNRMAALVLAAFFREVGITLDDVHLSCETVRRNRLKERRALSATIQNDYKNRRANQKVSQVYWDGKQFAAEEDKQKKIDRLPVLLSDQEGIQLLGVPRLDKGTGEEQAKAVYNCLKEWEVAADVAAMVFDTTAANTGPFNGACVLLEGLLGRNLLYLACRHHIFELLLKTAFHSVMGSTSSPNVAIFGEFQKHWQSLDKKKFVPGVRDAKVKKALARDGEEALAFAQAQLQNQHTRKDYREFLELIVMFFGKNLPNGNRFHTPGAIHNARWMAKAIYSLKMFLFRDQLQLSPDPTPGLRDVCIFIILTYQKAWFTAPDAIAAPRNDLELLKKLAKKTTSVALTISEKVLEKFATHLWYLSDLLIALAFFDPSVSLDCKRTMCQALKLCSGSEERRHKAEVDIQNIKSIQKLDLASFVSSKTTEFFEILKIDYSFLRTDPVTWEQREDFLSALKTVKSLHVTNDVAERGVALVSEYHYLLTKDESAKQDIMRIVSKLRELSSGFSKKSLAFCIKKYFDDKCASIPSDEK